MLKGSIPIVDPGPTSECDDFEDFDITIMTSWVTWGRRWRHQTMRRRHFSVERTHKSLSVRDI